MHLSIIIPAFNETRLIESCLQSVSTSLVGNGRPDFKSEIIVVDNNSTDNTAELARQAGAQVVFEPINQIGRARDAGAAEAMGDWLLFVDADSIFKSRTAWRYPAADRGRQERGLRQYDKNGKGAWMGKLDIANLEGPIDSLPLGGGYAAGVPQRCVSRGRGAQPATLRCR